MTNPGQRHDGLMESFCWCWSIKVLVTPDDVWHGRTKSCGAPDCYPPERPAA